SACVTHTQDAEPAPSADRSTAPALPATGRKQPCSRCYKRSQSSNPTLTVPTTITTRRLLDERFSSFFQGFWLRPIGGQQECQLSFNGTAQEVFAVVHDASNGRASAPLCAFYAVEG